MEGEIVRRRERVIVRRESDGANGESRGGEWRELDGRRK